MRKTSYAVTAIAVILTTVFTILSLTRTDWVVTRFDALGSHYEAKYGLSKACERLVINLPGNGSRLEDFKCRRFPTRDEDSCSDENRYFCGAWTSARYAVELAIGFGVLSFVTVLVGVSTHSRQRRIWRAVAGLVVLHAVLQLVAFALVVDLYRTSRFPTFTEAKLGPALVFNAVAWVLSVLTAISVILTGMAADRGKRWAAGNRAYQPIAG
ncbi:hypothetical protein B0H19DRAFT_1092690 [Mycena capillaripes]|nr:hypothetical protein B0H19DRAFT_1092690 [Mycena capillaripes]